MSRCYDELTLSIWSDGELPPNTSRAVEDHLATCAGCRETADALAAESGLLATVLEEGWEDFAPAAQTVPVAVAASAWSTRSMTWFGAGLLACVVAARLTFGWLAGFLPQGSGAWLNPTTISGRANLFFNSLFAVLEGGLEGVAAVLPLLSVTMALLVVAAFLSVHKRLPTALARA